MVRCTVVGSCVALLVLVAGCGGQAQQDERTESKSEAIAGGFSCSPASSRSGPPRNVEFQFDEYWIAFAPGMTYDPGLLVCPGAGNEPFVPVPGAAPTTCTPGRTKNQGFRVDGIQIVSTSPFAQGHVDSVSNRELDASGAGRTSGTFHVVLDSGGSWDGTFRGTRTVGTHCPTNPAQPCWEDDLELVGCGTGGDVQGMRFRATAHFDELFASFTAHFDAHAWDP